MQTDLIIISEYCRVCHVDPDFIGMLEEEGLIELQVIGKDKYITGSQLKDLEKFTRMYYDLSINIEGIDTINHLLNRINSLQQEIMELRSRLHLYRPQFSIQGEEQLLRLK
ncbi:chaperone modulator CbpM [Coprobacter tertius]|uniref:Chaperone modulator CbpM n=1 Tax=Coprobacter tertius TaxID=2944915 RepID=A0ABT1MJP2_9BACT|nr:chaperone modulator CbpM [Coprobacter tertius]MCP9611918.1 chaperone modulator CbpM [Coprobacter tertius]